MFNTPVNKAVIAALAILLNMFNAAIGDDVFDMTEKQHIITEAITLALGIWSVWRVPNRKVEDDGEPA